MRRTQKASGHLQVKQDKRRRSRAYYAYWRDATGNRHGRLLGPAHVKDSGRRTSRGAIIWRAGDGPRPTAEHLTPKDAAARLDDILRVASASTGPALTGGPERTLRDALEGWISDRHSKRGLRRSTIAGYEPMFERLCRDLGGDTPVRTFEDGRLSAYFESFVSLRGLGQKAAAIAIAEGKDVIELEIETWTAEAPGSQRVEVSTKAEAIRLAAELNGTWKHRAPGVYRVVPSDSRRARRVSSVSAQTLGAEGWRIRVRVTHRSVLRVPASPHTHNKYRDLLGAAFDYALRQGWLETNPVASISRLSTRAERQRILRRDDFYSRDEIDLLLAQAETTFVEAFWLCGAHAGLRLPGEALGLRWGAVDFAAGVLRPYDNWVLNQADDTKTAGFAPIPMTPRLSRALASLRFRDYATDDSDHVFASDALGRPASAKALRHAFVVAQESARLPPIKMYNLRHSFGTTLASHRVDLRTIQALMRHDRLSTTEQYLAYAPHPELATQLAKALESTGPTSADLAGALLTEPAGQSFFQRLEEEIPAKWLDAAKRAYLESLGA